MSGAGLNSLQQLRRAVHETVAGEREQTLQQTTGLSRRTQQHQLRDHTHCCHDDRVVVRLEAGEVGGQEGLHGTEKVKVHADSTNTSGIVTLWVCGLWPPVPSTAAMREYYLLQYSGKTRHCFPNRGVYRRTHSVCITSEIP